MLHIKTCKLQHLNHQNKPRFLVARAVPKGGPAVTPKQILHANKDKVLIAQVAPAVRVAIAEGFGKRPGEITAKQLVTALRLLGFSYVFDTLFAADVTIVEEASEFLHRISSGELKDKPMFTSCCPGWISLVEKNFPEILPLISTTKSPQLIMGAIVKHCFAPSIGLATDQVYHVSFMPCVRKQGEADSHGSNVDQVFTTNDLISLLKEDKIDLPSMPETDFDQPLGEGSGASAIFGTSGGVMTAALRYAYEVLTGSPLGEHTFTPLEGFPDVLEANIPIVPKEGNSLSLKVAVIIGLGSAKKFVKAVLNGTVDHKFVEVMACSPSGCVGGAGNPPVGKNKDLIFERRKALIDLDDKSAIKSSNQNRYVNELYDIYLDGKPYQGKAHDLFHNNIPQTPINTIDES